MESNTSTLDLPALQAEFRSEQRTQEQRKTGWRRAFLKALAKTGQAGTAARLAGVHPCWVSRVKSNNPRFARAYARALRVAVTSKVEKANHVEDALYDMATQGDTTTTTYHRNGEVDTVTKRRSAQAALGYLKANLPKRYDRPKQVQHTGSTTLIQSDIRLWLAQATPTEITQACNEAVALPPPENA